MIPRKRNQKMAKESSRIQDFMKALEFSTRHCIGKVNCKKKKKKWWRM